jgi:hypothetical protein
MGGPIEFLVKFGYVVVLVGVFAKQLGLLSSGSTNRFAA